MPRGKPFNKGEDDRRAKGGPRENAGRPTNLFKMQLEAALVEARDIDLIKAVISGVAFPRVINKEGEVVEIEATPKERLEAIKMGWEFLYSKAVEEHRIVDESRPSREELESALEEGDNPS